MTKTKQYKCSHALEQQLLRWALGGNVGVSSRYMAGVAAFGRNYKPCSNSLPRDFSDLKRCVAMASACSSFAQALPELRRVSPAWALFVDRWEELVWLVRDSKLSGHRAYQAYALIVNQIENTPYE